VQRSGRRVSSSRSINVVLARRRHEIQSNFGHFARLWRRKCTAWKLYTLSEDVSPSRHSLYTAGHCVTARLTPAPSIPTRTNEKLIMLTSCVSRPHRMHPVHKVRPIAIQMSHAAWSVCLCVGHTDVVGKNG